MEYKIEKVKEKPTKAPQNFCVYEYNNEKYIFCPIRNKLYKAKPEEIVRQWWIYRLRDAYGYEFSQIDVEVKVIVGATEAKKEQILLFIQMQKKGAAKFY